MADVSWSQLVECAQIIEVSLEPLELCTAEYVSRYAQEEQVGPRKSGNDDDMEESDGFLSSSDDEEDPPTTGIAEIS